MCILSNNMSLCHYYKALVLMETKYLVNASALLLGDKLHFHLKIKNR